MHNYALRYWQLIWQTQSHLSISVIYWYWEDDCMSSSETLQHDILLIIATAIFILFATGIESTTSSAAAQGPIIIPAG